MESQNQSPPQLAEQARRLGVGVIIPAYNPPPELKILLGELHLLIGLENVAVVNDGSTRAEQFNDLPPQTTVVHVAHGGKGWALRQGFAWAKQAGWLWAICMDADGQHAPGDLPLFLDAIEKEGADVVLGNRMDCVDCMPWLRWLTNWSTSKVISRMARQRVPDVQSGYRAIRLEILNSFELVTQNYDTESELLLKAAWHRFKIVTVPIQTIYRGGEQSHISKYRDTVRFLRLVRQAQAWRRAADGR